MKSKKAIGYVGTAVITLIIAALCIALLVGLAIKMYDMNKNNENRRIAEGHLGQIIGLINGLEDGQSEIYQLYSPNGWALVAWPNDMGDYDIDTGSALYYENKVPNQCNDKACLCICKYDYNNQLAACDSFSACKPFSDPNLDYFLNENAEPNIKDRIQINNLKSGKLCLSISLEGNVLRLGVIDSC